MRENDLTKALRWPDCRVYHYEINEPANPEAVDTVGSVGTGSWFLPTFACNEIPEFL